jgi:hypothetical protein
MVKAGGLRADFRSDDQLPRFPSPAMPTPGFLIWSMRERKSATVGEALPRRWPTTRSI